jgi:hypothetical protein
MSSEVSDLLDALYRGDTTLDDVAEKFRQRRWPRRRRPEPATYLELAARELEDPDPFVPGSYDDVAAAYHIGRLTDSQYAALVEAIAESERAEDAAGE